MGSIICTLFEKDFHYGVGALVNSLYRNGFRGKVVAGYRGELPGWAHPTRSVEGGTEYEPAEGVTLIFKKVDTKVHLTNYKAKFMLKVFDEYAPGKVFYFDPDIIVRSTWNFVEGWSSYGIALCEDINSPLSDTDPKRMAWRKFFEPKGNVLRDMNGQYVNGGFIGVRSDLKTFLGDWDNFIEQILGSGGEFDGKLATENIEHAFRNMDQDALNITLMLKKYPVSVIGTEGMGFRYGGYTMVHALGASKPWRNNYLKRVFVKGFKPSQADRLYLQNAEAPIRLYQGVRLRLRRANLLGAIGLGRMIGH